MKDVKFNKVSIRQRHSTIVKYDISVHKWIKQSKLTLAYYKTIIVIQTFL